MPEKDGKLPRRFTLWLYAAAVLIAGSIWVPWWGMTFEAPQYPEGLRVIVYPYKMAGRTDIINTLNQYIGMQPISEDSFKELHFLPYLIAGLVLLTLIVALLRNKAVLYGFIVLFAAGGILGIYDIHRWLYNFGHNLSPQAPIKIDPFVPPVFGSNRIANFITHSYFSYGSIMIGIAFVLLLVPIILSFKRGERP